MFFVSLMLPPEMLVTTVLIGPQTVLPLIMTRFLAMLAAQFLASHMVIASRIAIMVMIVPSHFA